MQVERYIKNLALIYYIRFLEIMIILVNYIQDFNINLNIIFI